jgi:trk system potassium uptake protein
MIAGSAMPRTGGEAPHPAISRRGVPPIVHLAIGLAALIAIGTALLQLPQATNGAGVGWLDAFFTATSAACVTGHVVVDTGTVFTRFGQAVILALIQLGGLGVMTVGTLILLALGQRPTQVVRQVLRGFAGHHPDLRARDVLVPVIGITFAFEIAGAGALYPVFARDLAPADALWFAVFHSVSAFCNAGFGLYADSFVRYADHPGVNLVVMTLIVFGGLGFTVLLEVGRWVRSRIGRRPRERLSLPSRVVLVATAVAIPLGAAFFFLFELTGPLGSRPISDRLWVSFFHSVSARTAGFNTVDLATLTNPTILLLLVLMFVGGGPGSMAGGIKVTSATAVVALVLQRLRGRGQVRILGRGVGQLTLDRAAVLALLGVVLIAVSVAALELTRSPGMPSLARRGSLVEIVFEAVSAFGTVGLSLGVTSALAPVAKVVLIVLMFVGRLGPLALMDYFAHRPVGPSVRYAEEELMVG